MGFTLCYEKILMKYLIVNGTYINYNCISTKESNLNMFYGLVYSGKIGYCLDE